MTPKEFQVLRREVSQQPASRPLFASSLERTLAEVNQIQRAMGVGVAARQVERVYVRLDMPSYQFRD